MSVILENTGKLIYLKMLLMVFRLIKIKFHGNNMVE